MTVGGILIPRYGGRGEQIVPAQSPPFALAHLVHMHEHDAGDDVERRESQPALGTLKIISATAANNDFIHCNLIIDSASALKLGIAQTPVL